MERANSPFIIDSDQSTVSGNVSREDRRKSSRHAVRIHLGFLPSARIIVGFWPKSGLSYRSKCLLCADSVEKLGGCEGDVSLIQSAERQGLSR